MYKFDSGTSEIVYVDGIFLILLERILKSRCSTAYASFGGLLLSLTGSYRHMTSIVLGEPVYVLMRR